ncbi:hypothetical protein [Sulfuricaulis sp.]
MEISVLYVAQLKDGLPEPTKTRHHRWASAVLSRSRIKFTGHLSRYHIEQGTGYAVPDHSAIYYLDRLGWFTETAAQLNGHVTDVQSPVICRLVEN